MDLYSAAWFTDSKGDFSDLSSVATLHDSTHEEQIVGIEMKIIQIFLLIFAMSSIELSKGQVTDILFFCENLT